MQYSQTHAIIVDSEYFNDSIIRRAQRPTCSTWVHTHDLKAAALNSPRVRCKWKVVWGVIHYSMIPEMVLVAVNTVQNRNFREVFTFANWITIAKIKTRKIFCLHSSMKSLYNQRHENVTLLVCMQSCWIWKICHCMQWRISTYSRQYITASILKPAMLSENIH